MNFLQTKSGSPYDKFTLQCALAKESGRGRGRATNPSVAEHSVYEALFDVLFLHAEGYCVKSRFAGNRLRLDVQVDGGSADCCTVYAHTSVYAVHRAFWVMVHGGTFSLPPILNQNYEWDTPKWHEKTLVMFWVCLCLGEFNDKTEDGFPCLQFTYTTASKSYRLQQEDDMVILFERTAGEKKWVSQDSHQDTYRHYIQGLLPVQAKSNEFRYTTVRKSRVLPVDLCEIVREYLY